MRRLFQLHETPDVFRQALSFTEADSGFSQRLIEKDYYCSLVLADFAPLFATGLVFKGGTCLSKVHADFFRLSEDLDFAISIPADANPGERRKMVAPLKHHLEEITRRQPAIDISGNLKGNNRSRQYRASLHYESVVTGERETVKVEVAVREPIIDPPVFCDGRTLLKDPVANESSEASLSICVMSLQEAYAEKLRAALTRDPPAIRDIFDVANAIRVKRLDFCDARFLRLVRQKLAVPGNSMIDTSENRRRFLEDQLETHLKPVLRGSDYTAFDVGGAFAAVGQLAVMIQTETLF